MVIYAIYGAIVLAILLLVMRRPSAALIMTTNLFNIKQWAVASSPFFARFQVLTNILAGILVLLGVLIHVFRGRIRRPLYTREAWLTAALFLYALVSIQWAPDYLSSMHYWKEGMPYVITIVFLASLTVQDVDDLHIAFSGILFFGTIIAALLLFTVKWEGRLITLGKDAFGESIGGNPLTVGLLGGTLVILAVLYRSPRKSMLFKLVKLAALFIGFALAVRSGSRGQVLGMVAVAGLFWTVASPSKNMFKPLMAVMLVAGMAVMAKIGIDFYWHGDKRFNVQMLQTDYAGRLHGVMFLIDNWIHSSFAILFGLGSSASYTIIGNYPHIVPLEVLCEEGILGFILLSAIVIGTVVKALRSLRSIGTDRDLRSLYACVAALWFYSLILINKQGSMLLSQDFFFFSVLLAKFGNLVKAKKSVESSSPSVAIRRGY
jgi:hypothetical protein